MAADSPAGAGPGRGRNLDWAASVVALKPVISGVYAIPLGVVNVFMIDGDGLTLVDTGIPGSAGRILAAVRALGEKPADIRHILVTHLHADHTGSLKALTEASGAPVSMHRLDADLVREGQASRPA